MAKHKLLASLVLGGVAYAAYHALDLEQCEALKDSAREQCNALKDRAVDYAFYAADALDDFKEGFNDHMAAKANGADAADFADSDATDHEAEDDIVLSSDEVADLHTPEAPAASTEPDDAADDASEKPEA